jgi:hypothetical protein
VQRSTTLAPGSWSEIERLGPWPTARTVSVTDAEPWPDGRGFYRVVLVLP